jgi:signal transduction histidine kinase
MPSEWIHQPNDRTASRPLLPRLALGTAPGIALLTLLYLVTGRLGLMLDPVHGFASAVWPPTGISLAALSLFGYRLWPGVALGALLVNHSAGAPWLAAGGMAFGNTLEALVGAYLMRRFAGGRAFYATIQGVLAFVLLVAGLSPVVSASMGVLSAWLGGVIPRIDLLRAWETWWIGDAMGALVLTPAIYLALEHADAPWTRRRAVEAAMLLTALLFLSLSIFGMPPTLGPSLPLEPYALFPLLIWATLRFGPQGAAAATVVVATVAVALTAAGRGPFAFGAMNESLVHLHVFMGILAVSMLVFAAAVCERSRSDRALLLAHGELEARIAERTLQLSETNQALRVEIAERKQAEGALRQLSARLLNVQDEERQRLARELHDSTAQELAALSMNLAVVRQSPGPFDGRATRALQECATLSERCTRAIRSISYLLHPPLLEEAGLPAAVRWCADGFVRRSGLSVDLDLPADFGRLPLDIERTLYRIVQECLNNVQRHSGSKTAAIRLGRSGDRVTLHVSDEGHGMPEGMAERRTDAGSLGLGILGMRERVRQLGGSLTIDSTPQGATVRVDIQLHPQETGVCVS